MNPLNQQGFPPMHQYHMGMQNNYPPMQGQVPPMQRAQLQVNTRDIFIKNLDQEITEDELRRWGNEFGTVTDVKFFPKNGWKNVILSMTEDSRPEDFIEHYNNFIPQNCSRRIGVSFMRDKNDLQRVQGQSVVVRVIGLPEKYNATDMADYIKEHDLDSILDSSYPYPITVRADSRPAGSRTNGSRSQGYVHCKSEDKARQFIKYLTENEFRYEDQVYELKADPLPKRSTNRQNGMGQIQMPQQPRIYQGFPMGYPIQNMPRQFAGYPNQPMGFQPYPNQPMNFPFQPQPDMNPGFLPSPQQYKQMPPNQQISRHEN